VRPESTPTDPRGFGTYLRDLRKGHGLKTQGALAAATDIGRTTIANVESGRRQPSDPFLKALEKRFPDQKEVIQAEAKRHGPSSLAPEDTAWRTTQGAITACIASGELDTALQFIDESIAQSLGTNQHLSARQYFWFYLHQAKIARLKPDPYLNTSAMHYVFAQAFEGPPDNGLQLTPAEYVQIYDDLICALLWSDGEGTANREIGRALTAFPQSAVLWYRKAALEWGQGNFAGSYAALTSALKTKPRGAVRVDIQCLHGLVQTELRQYSEALASLDEALASPRKLPGEHLCAESARLYAAFALGAIPQDRVFTEFARLEQLTPGNAWVYFYRCFCRLKIGDYEEAALDTPRAFSCDEPAVCGWALEKLIRSRSGYQLGRYIAN
jgi:tetratricopeptide (TPR) repeat protein